MVYHYFLQASHHPRSESWVWTDTSSKPSLILLPVRSSKDTVCHMLVLSLWLFSHCLSCVSYQIHISFSFFGDFLKPHACYVSGTVLSRKGQWHSTCNFWFCSLVEKTATEQVITRTLSFIKEKCSKPCEYLKGTLLFLFHFAYYSSQHTLP